MSSETIAFPSGPAKKKPRLASGEVIGLPLVVEACVVKVEGAQVQALRIMLLEGEGWRSQEFIVPYREKDVSPESTHKYAKAVARALRDMADCFEEATKPKGTPWWRRNVNPS